jgi:hypothetical protein
MRLLPGAIGRNGGCFGRETRIILKQYLFISWLAHTNSDMRLLLYLKSVIRLIDLSYIALKPLMQLHVHTFS